MAGKDLTKKCPIIYLIHDPVRPDPVQVFLSIVFCLIFLLITPVLAFMADSLNITVGTNGDAIANFHFTLQGVIENAIPLSVLQDQLTKGLATSSEPPQVLTFSKSEATLLLKGFAVTNTVPTGGPSTRLHPLPLPGLLPCSCAGKRPDNFMAVYCSYPGCPRFPDLPF